LARNIDIDFIHLLVAAEVIAQKVVVLSDILDFLGWSLDGRGWRLKVRDGASRQEAASRLQAKDWRLWA
jgi:hypothetical protein